MSHGKPMNSWYISFNTECTLGSIARIAKLFPVNWNLGYSSSGPLVIEYKFFPGKNYILQQHNDMFLKTLSLITCFSRQSLNCYSHSDVITKVTIVRSREILSLGEGVVLIWLQIIADYITLHEIRLDASSLMFLTTLWSRSSSYASFFNKQNLQFRHIV